MSKENPFYRFDPLEVTSYVPEELKQKEEILYAPSGFSIDIFLKNGHTWQEYLDNIELIAKQNGKVTVKDIYKSWGMLLAGIPEDYGWTKDEFFKNNFGKVSGNTWNIHFAVVPHELNTFEDTIDSSKISIGTIKETDNVNHPIHYKSESGLEVIDVIDAFTEGLMGREAICTGNVIKYICRWNKKNGLEDLKKAEWYLQKLIRHLELKEGEKKNA